MYPATKAEEREFREKWLEIQRLAAIVVKLNGHDIKIVSEKKVQ